jgi:hypothetical protein
VKGKLGSKEEKITPNQFNDDDESLVRVVYMDPKHAALDRNKTDSIPV